MRIRNGFVSNSSSSSFIVAVDKGKKGKFAIALDVDLEKLADKRITSIKELEEYAKEFGWDEEWHKEEYKRMKSEIERGKEVLVGSFASDSDNTLEQFLCEYGIPKDVEGITIIENEGGF